MRLNFFEDPAVAAPLQLACPEGMKWRDKLYIQWVHLQDATAYTGLNYRSELDDEIREFWDAVGAIFPDTAYASFLGFRDDSPDMNWTYPLTDNLGFLRTPYKARSTDKLLESLGTLDYPPSYDLYNMSFKVLTQATTTEEGNMFGWNNPNIPELSDSENVVRLVTLHTAAPGKVVDENCPNDDYWYNCHEVKALAKWGYPFTPGTIYNIPTKAEAYAQMDPNIIVQCVITTRGPGNFDVNWSQDWWRSVGCAISKSGHPKFGDIQCAGKGMFDKAKAEIIQKGCIPETAVSEVAAPKQFDFEKHFAEQEKLGGTSLDCPEGTHRKNFFLVQWLHLQETTPHSYDRRNILNTEIENFFDGIGNIYNKSTFNSVVAFTDDPWDENDPPLLSTLKNFSSWNKVKGEYIWKSFDEADYVSNYDGFEGGWKAMVLASTIETGNHFGWDSSEATAITTNEHDILRVVTMHTQAPGKVPFDDGQRFQDYCTKYFGEGEWKNCLDTNNYRDWTDKYNEGGRFNLPTVREGTNQMSANTVYSVLVSPTQNSSSYYHDAPGWWNTFGCRMRMRGFNFNVVTDASQLFENARKEFVRRSCLPN